MNTRTHFRKRRTRLKLETKQKKSREQREIEREQKEAERAADFYALSKTDGMQGGKKYFGSLIQQAIAHREILKIKTYTDCPSCELPEVFAFCKQDENSTPILYVCDYCGCSYVCEE